MLTMKCQGFRLSGNGDRITFEHNADAGAAKAPLVVCLYEAGRMGTVILTPEQARHLARELLRKYGNSEDTSKWEGCL